MANIKITQLTEIVAPANEDVLPIVDVSGDITQKVQAANLPISTATQTALDAKQDTLVSGTNIKTINSTSLLGSGDISIAATPAGTDGQIQFSDGSAFAADSNLFWDNTNKRLGVGTNSPQSDLDILTSNGVGFVRVSANGGGSARITGDFSLGLNARGSLTFENNLTEVARVTSVGMGIKTLSNPTARLEIKGSGSTSATTSLLVQNSSGTAAFQVKDDLQVQINFGDTLQNAATPNLRFSSTQTGVFSPNQNQLGIACYGNETARFIFGSALHDGALSIGKFANPYNNAFFGWCSDGSLEITGNAQSVFINPTNNSSVVVGASTAQASAILQADSTTKGFLPPRMTTTQKNAISSPAAGLQVYDSTTNRAAVYSTAWENVITETNGSPNSVYKLWSGSAAQYAALTPDSSTLYFVI